MNSVRAQAVAVLTLLLAIMGHPVRAELSLVSSEAGIFRSSGAKEQIDAGSRVEGHIGVKFGLRFTVANKSDNGNRVKYIYLTPGIILPNGSRQDKIELIKDLSAQSTTHTMAFEFSDRNEIRYGEWTMMVFEQDRLLAKAVFEVVIPEDKLGPP